MCEMNEEGWRFFEEAVLFGRTVALRAVLDLCFGAGLDIRERWAG